MAFLTDFYVKQGDTLEPIVVALQDAGGNLISRTLVGSTIEFHMKTDSGTLLIVAGVGALLDNTAKTIGYQWIPGDTDTASPSVSKPHQAEFQVTYADGGVETFPNTGNINVHVYPEIA